MQDPSARDDLSLELVQSIQAGDHSAWEALYLRYRDQLLLSIRCRLGAGLRNRLQSEDILHSVVREVIASELAGFEPRGPRSLERYLHTCVLNKIRSKAAYFGAQKRTADVPLSDSILEQLPNDEQSAPRYMDAERYGRLERALLHLPDPMREVVILRAVEGLSNQEAARVIDKTTEATSKLYNRAIARLGVTTLRQGAAP